MVNGKTLIRHLDELLRVKEIPDSSRNGLQVQGRGEVRRVAFAVDACLASINEAAGKSIDLLIVHHGLFWKEVQLVVNAHHARLKALLAADLGLYAVHLPLDCHPELGNNRRLADILGLNVVADFGNYEGTIIGKIAAPPRRIAREELQRKIEEKLKADTRLLPFGPEKIERVGVVSGGGQTLLKEAITSGCDSFLTGEIGHETYHIALEGGINVFLAGHYATETVGLRALGKHVDEEFDIETEFIDFPTGL